MLLLYCYGQWWIMQKAHDLALISWIFSLITVQLISSVNLPKIPEDGYCYVIKEPYLCDVPFVHCPNNFITTTTALKDTLPPVWSHGWKKVEFRFWAQLHHVVSISATGINLVSLKCCCRNWYCILLHVVLFMHIQ